MSERRKEELEKEQAMQQDGRQAPEEERAEAGDAHETGEESAAGEDIGANEDIGTNEDTGANEDPEVIVPEPDPCLEEQLALERDQFKDKWMRAVAETDNVRKRSRREVQDARRFAQAETLRPFLEVYDNFERALRSMNETELDEQGQSVRQGVELIFQRFQAALKERGAKLIPVDGCEFDPSVHEAVGSMPREGVEAGHVIEVAQQGFQFGDMVLRPARVIVSS
ncbi:nucleotide exchange factor GrpE [bacterium DOLZORAL124_64_63]|nr:MAG: nucleotide exchange factor GrpE [bacterium DOLZORAL124_64_63]